jgi:hypothetical protein
MTSYPILETFRINPFTKVSVILFSAGKMQYMDRIHVTRGIYPTDGKFRGSLKFTRGFPYWPRKFVIQNARYRTSHLLETTETPNSDSCICFSSGVFVCSISSKPSSQYIYIRSQHLSRRSCSKTHISTDRRKKLTSQKPLPNSYIQPD